MSPRQDIDL